MATSTAEAEFIAAAMGVKEALWARKLLAELCGFAPVVPLRVDNQSAITVITQPTAGQNGKTKHIDVQFHFVRERCQRGELNVQFVPTESQLADMFTKQLGGPEFKQQVSQIMGMA